LNNSIKSVFRSLTHRFFTLLWSGQTISRLGDSLYRIALAWWVLEKTGSAAIMGTVLIFSTVPMLLFLLIGGVVVDRFNRAWLMLASDLLRGIVVVIVAGLAVSQQLEVWHIFLASTIFGIVDAFFQPAYTSIVPDLTPSEALPSANSMTSLSGQAAGIIGPALGASLIALGGTPVAFMLDALSFFISAACLIPLLKVPAPRSVSPGSSSMMRDLREGIGTVFGSPWLWITIVTAALGNICTSGSIGIALPFLVKGRLLGTIWLSRYSKLRRRGLVAYSAWVFAGLMIAVMGLSSSVLLVAFAAMAIGVSFAIFGLIWTNSLQELVPHEQLGRVSSIDFLGSFALMPIGFGVVGWATDQLGAPLIFVIGGVLTVGLATLGLTHPAIRNLD
jgi:DHA3 family tetracycline resistance protein-like MFS transporter